MICAEISNHQFIFYHQILIDSQEYYLSTFLYRSIWNFEVEIDVFDFSI